MEVAKAPPENPSRIESGPHTCRVSMQPCRVVVTYKEVVEQDVERGDDEQGIGRYTHQTLGLKVPIESAGSRCEMSRKLTS